LPAFGRGQTSNFVYRGFGGNWDTNGEELWEKRLVTEAPRHREKAELLHDVKQRNYVVRYLTKESSSAFSRCLGVSVTNRF
jgi:hypothetical protein